jgi:hypothetical protein
MEELKITIVMIIIGMWTGKNIIAAVTGRHNATFNIPEIIRFLVNLTIS